MCVNRQLLRTYYSTLYSTIYSTGNCTQSPVVTQVGRKPRKEGIMYINMYIMASLVAQLVKNLPAMQKTRVRFLGQGIPGKIPWRRKWQPTPVFLPGESHGQRSLAGYSPWGRKESDPTEQLNHLHHLSICI